MVLGIYVDLGAFMNLFFKDWAVVQTGHLIESWVLNRSFTVLFLGFQMW